MDIEITLKDIQHCSNVEGQIKKSLNHLNLALDSSIKWTSWFQDNEFKTIVHLINSEEEFLIKSSDADFYNTINSSITKIEDQLGMTKS